MTSKLTLIGAILALMLVVSDVQQRLLTKPHQSANISAQQSLTEVVLPMLPPQLISELGSAFANYDLPDGESSSTEPLPGLSLEEQALQQGLLQTVFIGDRKLQLKAVIAQQANRSMPHQVLLLVTDLQTNSAVIEKYSPDSDVYGYNLNINNTTQVNLTKNTERGEQIITLTMYKPQVSAPQSPNVNH